MGETRVFEEGQMGAAPDGKSLSTYQELCSLANEMGQPDLIYRFMDLANNQVRFSHFVSTGRDVLCGAL